MSLPDGGPAFPVQHRDTEPDEGMSLRDWFAGQALCGLLQNLHVQGSFDHGVTRNAEAAFALADEMLKVRSALPPVDGGSK